MLIRVVTMYKKRIKWNWTQILCVFIFMIVSIYSIYAARLYINPSLGNLAVKQLLWYGLGIVVFWILTKVPAKWIIKGIYPFYVFMILSLVGLLFFGTSINNSRCWYVIPYLGSIEPCEFMKISLVLLFAKEIDAFNKRRKVTFKQEFFFLCKMGFYLLLPVVLTFLQPDTGSIFIYTFIAVVMLFCSKLSKRWFWIIGGTVVVLLAIFLYLYFFQEELFIQIFSSNIYYRLNRLKDFRDGTSMQLENALVAIGSAGLFGHGSLPLYFPEPATDFIFSVFASSVGLIGTVLFLLVLVVFDYSIFKMAEKGHGISKFLWIGLLATIAFGQIQNIGMNIGLLPIMGITLPFISYGGSSLLSYSISFGLFYAIQKEV